MAQRFLVPFVFIIAFMAITPQMNAQSSLSTNDEVNLFIQPQIRIDGQRRMPQIVIPSYTKSASASVAGWYDSNQKSIDLTRKGDFSIRVLDRDSLPVSIPVSINHIQHEFKWGISYDFSPITGYLSNQTSTAIRCNRDTIVYQTERRGSQISYEIPVESNQIYRVTLKLAEQNYTAAQKRVFSCSIEGEKKIDKIDKYAWAKGQYIAIDTTVLVACTDGLLNLDFVATIDQVAISGIEVHRENGTEVALINCGGYSLATPSGRLFKDDMLFFQRDFTKYATEDDFIKSMIAKYFNYLVTGNAFKWSGIQPQHKTPNYSIVDEAVRWTRSRDMDMRFHTLLWGAANDSDYHCVPEWVVNLKSPQMIYDTCEMRVRREVKHYRGIAHEYDVINEPLHANWLQSVVGDSLNWNCFKWAREEDPDVSLCVNDYNILYSWGDVVKYKALVNKMLANGAPVSGIGCQGHMWWEDVNVADINNALNSLAQVGLPIKITEFDISVTDPKVQANETAKMMRLLFAHPSVDAMISWGLTDKGVWRENSGILSSAGTPKAAADSIYHLTKEIWTTHVNTKTSSDGVAQFNGYYGDYEVEVTYGGQVYVYNLSCLKKNKGEQFEIVEGTGRVKGPEVIDAYVTNYTKAEVKFDKPIDPKNLRSIDFNLFAKFKNKIVSSKVIDTDNTVVEFIFDREFNINDWIYLSYIPGTLTSTNGGVMTYLNSYTMKNNIPKIVSASTDNTGKYLELKFNYELSDPTTHVSNFTVKVDKKTAKAISVKYKGNDRSILVVELETAAKKGSEINVAYTSGTITTDLDILLKTFSATAVTNQSTTSVRELGLNDLQLSIFPNPARNQVQIVNQSLVSYRIAIGNLLGQELIVVDAVPGVHNLVDISTLQRGIYLISATNGAVRVTEKLIVK